jgi:hypothetical protein
LPRLASSLLWYQLTNKQLRKSQKWAKLQTVKQAATIWLILLLGTLSVVAQTSHSVTVTWPANTTGDPATTYNVLRGTASGAESSAPIGSVLASACTASCTYIDNAVVGGTTYFYEITATNSGGTSAPSLETSFSVPFFAPAAPAKPTVTGH